MTDFVRYTNPVWNGYFADPYVLKASDGVYYAYGTGAADAEGKAFPVLRSKDMGTWEPVGGALLPRADLPSGSHYWAAAVAENDGRFFMYYSAAPPGNDAYHRLRVAVSDTPSGPFTDCGHDLLPPETGFTIDAEPFCDPQTGQWYLFYARDFLDEPRPGTGLAVVPLAPDLLHPSGAEQTVLRAWDDRHIYQRDRAHYGSTWAAWHTVEGPAVVFHDNKYWCFFSGGNWHTAGYGVGWSVADHPLGPWQASDNLILQGDESKGIIGPGHNSVALAPDNQTHFLVYHAWDTAHTARRMCIDPIIWTPDGPVCDGPTNGEAREIPLAAR